MKSCNDCVHHFMCFRHKAMADKIRIQEYPMTIGLALFCIENERMVMNYINLCRGDYMHEIAEAELATRCSDWKQK